MKGLLVVATVALALAGGAAKAEDPGEDLLARAGAKARSGAPEEAAALYGEALAAAQKEGDLLEEQAAANAFLDLVGNLRGKSPEGVLAAALGKMDAKRCGAFVSAPLLAGEVVLSVALTGEPKNLAAAAAVLQPHAKSAKSGLWIRTAALLAKSMGTARGESPAAAAASLQEAIDAALAEQWADLALAAGVELAALQLRLGDKEKARAAVGAAVSLLGPKTEQRYLRWWNGAAETRLKDAPEEVLEPWKNSAAYMPQGGSVSAGGGRGGAGGSGGSGASPLGKALMKASRTTALATAARTRDGFEVRVSWDPKFRGVQQRQDGQRYLDDGGLTLAFADWGVSVALLDLTGGHGQPGESSEAETARAFYRLARGETWGLSKDGAQISGK